MQSHFIPETVRFALSDRADAAHSRIATLPLAPGVFSKKTVWPRIFVSFLAAERRTISELPPGANGTSRRIGLVGQPLCA